MRKAFLLMAILMLAATAAPTFAGEKAPAVSSKPAGETAVYTIPGLLEGSMLKDLAKTLAGKPGIMIAQLDPQAKTFNVTFDPKQTNPQQILETLKTVAKDARFDKVIAAQGTTGGPAPDCGKCPHSKSCAGAKPKK